VPTPEQRICLLAQEVADAQDPLRALETLVELRIEIEAVTSGQVARGLRAGHSFGDFARVMGISRQAVHRRYRDLARVDGAHEHGPLATTEEVRRVVFAASREAGQAQFGSEHVLIAVLRCGGDAARELEKQGVTLAAVREALAAQEPDPRPSAFARPSDGIREVLAEAARVSLARGEREIGAYAVLLAALSRPDAGARRVLGALGVDLASTVGLLERERTPPDAQRRSSAAYGTPRGHAA
jgi:Clp amino terminal domain, pathogenicity island component